MMTKSHLSELSLRMSFHPEWVIKSAGCEWKCCGFKGFLNFVMSSILTCKAGKGWKTHLGKIRCYETPVEGTEASGLLDLEQHREVCAGE